MIDGFLDESTPIERVVVGLDVGGTKTAIRIESTAGAMLVDLEVASDGWDASPANDAALWVAARIAAALPPGTEAVAVGVGAQGLDSPAHTAEFVLELRALGYPTLAVNDAALLVPAAGFESGIGIIAGTGAVAVGQDPLGAPLITGGWGWVLGDEAGAAGIVREATKAALLANDDGKPDDGLLSCLLAAFDVDNAERLARAVNDEPTMENWGTRAPAVFTAANRGSALALDIIHGAAAHLVRLVSQLRSRDAVGTHLVVAGSVIVNQPRLFDEVVTLIAAEHPGLVVVLLTEKPVAGAVAVARRLLPAH
jgi:N-acetylglucosamine kinase-like BadF-type ATPase